MANESVLNMFDPLNVELPPSSPSTPLEGTFSKGPDARAPLTLSTYFNRRPTVMDGPPSPKRAPNPLMPLVQLDDSMIVNEEEENSLTRQSSTNSDDLLTDTPHSSTRRHPLLDRQQFGASTASVDSLSMRNLNVNLGMSLTNGTTYSLLRQPMPSQLREDSTKSSRFSTKLDNSSSFDIPFTESSFDLLRDEIHLSSLVEHPSDFSALADDEDRVPRPRTARPSHAVLEEFPAVDQISPVKPRPSQSPVRTEAEDTPRTSPSRKSKFTFKRWPGDKGTSSATASPATRSKPSTPRAASPISPPKSGTSLFEKLRGTSQESRRSKPNTPLATKSTTPVNSTSPASTVRGSGEPDQAIVSADEFGVASPSTYKSKTRPAPIRTASSTSTSAGTGTGSGSGSSAPPPSARLSTSIRDAGPLRRAASLALRTSKAPPAPVPPASTKASSAGARRIPASASATIAKPAAKPSAPLVQESKPASKLAKPTATKLLRPRTTLSRPSEVPKPVATAPPAKAPLRPTTTTVPRPSSAVPRPPSTVPRPPSTVSKPPPTASKPPPAPSSRFGRASISVAPSAVTKPVGFGHARSRSQIPTTSETMPTPAPASGVARSSSLRVPQLKKPAETSATATATRRTFGMR